MHTHTHTKGTLALIPYHMATTMLSMFYVFRLIPQDALVATPTSHNL